MVLRTFSGGSISPSGDHLTVSLSTIPWDGNNDATICGEDPNLPRRKVDAMLWNEIIDTSKYPKVEMRPF